MEEEEDRVSCSRSGGDAGGRGDRRRSDPPRPRPTL